MADESNEGEQVTDKIAEQLKKLMQLAQQTPPADRERVLAAACADPALRLRALEMAEDAELREAAANPPIPFGGRIGPYSLLRHVGSGGMGSVYLAERVVADVAQRSALKVLAPHAAGRSFVERFRREQQILASLDSPNITRMLDAGLTDTGQPYLVMEYVDGVHLDDYCSQRHLGIDERLKIFLRVCDAVSYAHRNLIVHLDLKPSNILVTADGTVKLLDFGTSKLLEPNSESTGTLMATPAYASPEQLRGEPVTTACDLYALGSILFQQLAGQRPYAKATLAGIYELAIREHEPEQLTQAVTGDGAQELGLSEVRLRGQLRGDLSTIVAKCMAFRPRDRYASVDALSADLHRYLEGRPVLARPQTTLYRAGKFVRRNRRGVIAGTLAALLLIASLSYAEWRQRQALLEGQRALSMQTFLYRLFKLANSNNTGKPAATVPEFLQLGVKLLPDYIRDPTDLRKAQIGLAESMYENGDQTSAQRVFTETMQSAKAAGDKESEAESEAYAGTIAFQQGQTDDGLKLMTHALELSHGRDISPAVKAFSARVYAINRENSGFRSDENVQLLQYAVRESRENHLSPREIADALYDLASDYEIRGELDLAQARLNEALSVYAADPLALCDQSEVYGDLAFVEEMRGEVQQSLPIYQKAYDGYKTCTGPESTGALTEREYMAGALVKLGRAPEAYAIMQESMPGFRKLLDMTPAMAEPLNFLALADLDTGHFAEAEAAAREMVEVQVGKVKPTDRRFGAAHLLWGRALVGEGHPQEALPHAKIADQLLYGTGKSAGAIKMGNDAHQLLLDVQGKLAAH